MSFLTKLLDRPIAFHRPFVDLGVGVTGALMLSQAIYWSKRTRDADGWFYKTQIDWQDETGMTRTEQDNARKRLKAIGVLQEHKKGVPCKVYYRIDFEALQTRLQETCKLDSGKPANSDAGNPQTITETTAETTTESKQAPRKRGPILMTTYLYQCKEDGKQPLPESSAVFKYQEKTGLPMDFLLLAWKEFKDRSIDNGKKYKSWPTAFLNCVRDNWYGLWWVNDNGEFLLTSKGKQAETLHGVVHA